MHDEDGFLAAIRLTPADDVARLVFADWLDEQDDPACKLKADFIRLELRMAETPTESLNRLGTLQQLEALAAQIAPDWLVTVSHPKLEACRMQFQLECPKHWAGLTPSDDPKVRFCDTCKKHVHYCDTLQDAQHHAANGNCVALSVVLARRACLARPPQPPAPKFIARERPVARSIGLALARPADPPLTPPGQYIRLTPDMIERLGRPLVADRLEIPDPTPVSIEPEPVERSAGERPKWKRERKKRQRRQRNIQRENWEEME